MKLSGFLDGRHCLIKIEIMWEQHRIWGRRIPAGATWGSGSGAGTSSAGLGCPEAQTGRGSWSRCHICKYPQPTVGRKLNFVKTNNKLNKAGGWWFENFGKRAKLKPSLLADMFPIWNVVLQFHTNVRLQLAANITFHLALWSWIRSYGLMSLERSESTDTEKDVFEFLIKMP